jgi:CMP-N-acetylneuraminate monooxygenase
MLTDIGDVSILRNTPKIIHINDQPFILNKNQEGNIILYNAICPHQHGVVDEINENIWRCPSHGWTYTPENGKSINSPSVQLESFSVIKKNDRLLVELPSIKEAHLEISHNNVKGPKISIISNASMLIEWKGKRLITDPWIEGPSVFGSWIQYPPNRIKVSDLPKIDAIWISHEHSDHLHPETLSKFDKNIPVYVPKLQGDRLGQIVKRFGFKDVLSMNSFESFNIADTIEAISFKSASFWNDAILFLRTGEFTLLNFNDAGINRNVKNKIDKVDLISASFSQSASAYPSNWTHIDDITKNKMMDDRNIGMLKVLKQMVKLFHARFLLPIASFNALWLPEHFKYERTKKRNSLNDILNYFKDENVKVLDLLPGESWSGDNSISRREDREKYFNDEFRYKFLKEEFKNNKHKNFIPLKFDIQHEDIKKYFEDFSNTDLARYIGQMELCLTSYDSKRSLTSLIDFSNGDIKYEELDEPVNSNLVMSCYGPVVQEIIQNDMSWDEAQFWCSLHRNPDVYNLAFWRLLHAPWRTRLEDNSNLFSRPLSSISIATLIEKGGKEVAKILEEQGMYCTGCPPSVGENLQDGCNIHGISNKKMNEMILKIKKIINPKIG